MKSQAAAASASRQSLVFSAAAFSKPILHAAKFPWAQVSGFFIGRVKVRASSSGDDEAGASSSSTTTVAGEASGAIVEVVDAIPLFHNPILTPILDVAAMIVTEYGLSLSDSGKEKRLSIVGFYCGNSRSNDISPNVVARKAALNIVMHQQQQQQPQVGFLAVIDNELIANPKAIPFIIYSGKQMDTPVFGTGSSSSSHSGNEGRGKKSSPAASLALAVHLEDPSCQERLTQQLKDRVHELSLVDFEESLHDVSCDWRNLIL
jgi:hypothetical protein